MPSCSVKWCSNHTSTCSLKSKNGVSFHRFPKDEETCQKWVEAVRYERRDPWWTSSNASRICSIHFKETDISSTPCKVNVLSKTAVPICTMVWYDENENNIPSITFNEKTKTDKPILKTYARKKTNMNVLKESKVNTSNNCNKESTTMSKINSVAISNMTPCQDSVPQVTKLLKTLEVSTTQHFKEGQEPNSAHIDLNTSIKENVTEVQKNTVLTELNKTENIKPKEKCSKSNILVKLNDNTNLILDEDLSNDDTKLKESNIFCEEPNTRTCENSKKSNENTEPNQVTNISNADTFVQTITNGNVELNANISKSYVGKMLKTYLPKRKDKISEKINKKTSKLKKNKSVWTITMDKGLNIIKCNEINNTSVKHIKDYFKNKLKTGVCHKNNIIMDLQSNTNPQEKTQLCALNNVKKYTFKRRSNLSNRQRIEEQNKLTVDVQPNIDVNKDSNISYLDDFITNQSKIYKIKETDTAVYDEIISELFETSKNVSNTLNNSNYQASNENVCIISNTVLCTDNNIDSALDKGTNNTHVILDLDTNIYSELNTLTDSELYSVVNTGLNGETNTEINTDKTAINKIIQYNENTATESTHHLTIMNNNMATVQSDYLISDPYYYLHKETNENIITQDNKNMSYNENLTDNVTILSKNELQNLETSVVKNIVPETKKIEFNILKKYLTMKSKLDSPSELCTNVQTDIDKNIFSRYDNITSTSLIKENAQVSDRDHNTEFNTNIDIEVNDMIAPIQNNINTSATIETESNVTSSKQLNSILLEEFITKIAPESINSEKVNFITNFNTDPNTTKVPELNENNISDINVECTKILEKDMTDLDTVMNLELCREDGIGLNDEMNIGLNEVFNTDKTDINVDPSQYNASTVTESDQPLSITNDNMPMEHSDHLIPESDYYLHTEMNENITTEGNKNKCYNENIIINAITFSHNDVQILDTSVVNNIKSKKDKFTELRKHLSTKPKLNSLVDLCTNTLTDTDKNWFSKYSTMSMAITKENIQVPDRGLNAEFDKQNHIEVNDAVTSLENNMYIDANKETKPILLEELITNIIPELNNSEDINFINNLKTNSITTGLTSNKKMISDSNECNKILGKDMPELNTVILPELNEEQILNSKEVMNAKFDNLNTEMYTDKDVLLQKSKKDFVSVLPMPEDQHTVVNKHMDVVDSILNRDVAAEFDLSLLLSDTPIPDEDIQNVDNSNNNSLDGIGGSPNWIQLPTGEIPKIIDDILDQGSPYFGNLDLFDKVNKCNMDKEANKKDNGNKKKYLTSNFEQFEEQVINNYCETGQPCTKISIAQIEKELLAEISDYNEKNLEQSNIICTKTKLKLKHENKVSQTKKNTAEKSYDLCDNQTGKQILEYLHLNKEQCNLFNLDQIGDKRCEHSRKEIQGGNKTINQCQKQKNIDSLENQIENPSIGQYFEQSENPYREQDGLNIDNSNEVLNDEDILELSKKQYQEQCNEQTYQQSVGKLVTTEESIPKFNILSQGTFESSFQEINKELPNLNAKKIEEVNNVSNEAHTAGTESVRGLNIGKLKRVIFEECYDPECGNNCKNQKHNSNTESHQKDDQQYKKQNNNISSQPDIEKRKMRFNVLYKRQRYQSSMDNLNKQLNDGSVDPNTKQKKKKIILERPKLSHNENCKTNYKKIAIDHIPGQYVELRWNESDEITNSLSQEGCKRKHKELDLDQRKMLCSESTNNFSQQIMECPECGYSTNDNDLMNYKSDVDLRITKPLSLINKDMLISLRDTENIENNKKVALESVYAMELAYVTAIQALERKLKQKMAISEYRLRKVNNLSKINDQLTKASVTLMEFSQKNKV